MGKIKSIMKDGKNVKSGVAGDTVVISGINHTINGGEWLFEVKNEAFANEVGSFIIVVITRLLTIVNDDKNDRRPLRNIKKEKRMKLLVKLLRLRM